jgi:hypothetical protein
VEAADDDHRRAHLFELALIALPGWLIVVGVSVSIWLYDRSSWSSVPFIAGGLLAILLMKGADARIDDEPRPEERGRILWISGIAADLRLSRLFLMRHAKAARLPDKPVVALAWAPWCVLLGLWTFLALNAVVELSLGSGG